MNKQFAGILGLLVLLGLFFALNIIATGTLKSTRVDLTADRLYTLSDGARKIARDIDEPISLTFYFSKKAAVDRPDVRTHGQRVQEMLQEFANESKGKIKLKIVNPEPFSEEEQAAADAGLQGAPINARGDVLYFGLVGTDSTNVREVVPMFDPSNERMLEYDLSKILYTLRHAEKKKIGLMGSLGLGGFDFNPATRQPTQKPKWYAFSELDRAFTTEVIPVTASEIPADIKVLVVVHPKALSDQTLYAIDQFVMRGGHLLAFIDPVCQTDDTVNTNDQFQGMFADRSSSLTKLLDAWGIEVPNDKVVLDRTYAVVQQVRQEQRVVEASLPQFLMLRKDAFNAEDEIGRAMEVISTFLVGAIRPKPEFKGSALTITPILSSSDDSMMMDKAEVQFAQDPSTIVEKFASSGAKHVIAARLSGNVKSAFEAGPPIAKPVEGQPPAPSPDASKHVKESTSPAQIILVADVDMLNDRAWTRAMNLGGQQMFIPVTSNGQLLLLGAENLSGSSELLSIRPRGQGTRPFDRVDRIRKDAEKQSATLVREKQDLVSKKEQELEELIRKKQPNAQGMIDVTPDLEAKISAIRAESTLAKRELRGLVRERDRDIEALGNRVKFVNIALVPAGVSLLAIGLGVYRSNRRGPRK